MAWRTMPLGEADSRSTELVGGNLVALPLTHIKGFTPSLADGRESKPLEA